MLNFMGLNYGVILVSTLVTFVLGVVWYAALFSKPWQTESGVTDKMMKDVSPAMTYGGAFVCFFLLNMFVAALVKSTMTTTWTEGALLGFQVGLFVNLASLTINYLYQYKSMKLWMIDGGYQVIVMTVAGVILGVWR